MTRKTDDIKDEGIRFIGLDEKYKDKKREPHVWIIIVSVLLVLGILSGIFFYIHVKPKNEQKIPFFESLESPSPIQIESKIQPVKLQKLGQEVNPDIKGFCEIIDSIEINDIPLRVFLPHNAEMSLHIGRMNLQDTTVIYAAQAADIRADNGKIVGAFVLKGEPKAWGLSKKGFCAYIDGQVSVGVEDNSPLFEEATERGGYFFRQYPLVKDGVLVENEPKNKSIRRAICDRQGEIFMIESLSRESFHDFAQALVDLGVDQAIYLVGGDAYGWAFDEHGVRHEFGDDGYYTGRRLMPPNISYIVWRRQEN